MMIDPKDDRRSRFSWSPGDLVRSDSKQVDARTMAAEAGIDWLIARRALSLAGINIKDADGNYIVREPGRTFDAIIDVFEKLKLRTTKKDSHDR